MSAENKTRNPGETAVDDAMRRTVLCVSLKRYEKMSDASRVRIRAGVMRGIRSTGQEAAAPGWAWAWNWKLAAGTAVAVIAGSAMLMRSPAPVSPITQFRTGDLGAAELAEQENRQIMDSLQVASNDLPANLQFAPVEAMPVEYTVP